MTGHPGDNDNEWDAKTKALMASLEALLELHRDQARNQPGPPDPAAREAPDGNPGMPALNPR